MANRINKNTAELVALPPTTWYTRTILWLLEQPTFENNYHNIPVQEPLVESIWHHGIKAPLLVMPNWYPICGSQRLRACVDIAEKTMGMHPILQQEVRVARFDKEYWNVFDLWPDKEFKAKAKQVYFQTMELAWKSMHFIENDPEEMIKYETDGDKLRWKARDG